MRLYNIDLKGKLIMIDARGGWKLSMRWRIESRKIVGRWKQIMDRKATETYIKR